MSRRRRRIIRREGRRGICEEENDEHNNEDEEHAVQSDKPHAMHGMYPESLNIFSSILYSVLPRTSPKRIRWHAKLLSTCDKFKTPRHTNVFSKHL